MWYDHVPEKVEETDHVKILWDFNIQTDHVIEHRRPDVENTIFLFMLC